MRAIFDCLPSMDRLSEEVVVLAGAKTGKEVRVGDSAEIGISTTIPSFSKYGRSQTLSATPGLLRTEKSAVLNPGRVSGGENSFPVFAEGPRK